MDLNCKCDEAFLWGVNTTGGIIYWFYMFDFPQRARMGGLVSPVTIGDIGMTRLD